MENYQRFHTLLTRYRTGDFELLSSICASICIFEEYITTPPSERLYLADNEAAFLDYLARVYGEHIALVLKYDEKCFSYSRKYIIKMVRGEGKHGQSELRDRKREALHKFLFEGNKLSEYVFAITHNWVIYPGVWRKGGNRDSSNAFLESVKIDGQAKHCITTMESVIFNIALEIWTSFTLGKVVWYKQVIIVNRLEEFIGLIGLDAVNNINSQLGFWQKFKENAQILRYLES